MEFASSPKFPIQFRFNCRPGRARCAARFVCTVLNDSIEGRGFGWPIAFMQGVDRNRPVAVNAGGFRRVKIPVPFIRACRRPWGYTLLATKGWLHSIRRKRSGNMTIIVTILVVLSAGVGLLLVVLGAFGSRRRRGHFAEQYHQFHADRGEGASAPSDSATLKCQFCGHMNLPDGDYCGRCGKQIVERQSASGGTNDGQ